MPVWSGGYRNPFYHAVALDVQEELNRRALHAGRKVRGAHRNPLRQSVAESALNWSYGKTAYGHVIGGNVALGFPGERAMTDRSGNLTLYSSTRNVPRFPLLQSIDVTNDGTIGSLLRGKFTFTYWPEQNWNSFNMKGVDNAFLVPGKEVKLSWGWSSGGDKSRQAFTGIINNFNWSFNADMSMTTEVSIVSAATISIGLSGDQSTKNTDPASVTTDPAGVAILGANLATIIDTDIAVLSGSVALTTPGQTDYKAPADTPNKLMEYVAIAWPYQDESAAAGSAPTLKTFWYIKVGALVSFGNYLIDQYEAGGSGALGEIFDLFVWGPNGGNTTQYLPELKSSYPQDVYFNDPAMGLYGTVVANNAAGYNLTLPTNRNLIQIGQILLGTEYVKETYRSFIEENAANIPYKNITNFFETILKRINTASGDAYQISAVLCENPINFDGSNRFNPQSSKSNRTLLSIEDNNLAEEHTKNVKPYNFRANIFQPLIKNVSISSKPPAPLAAAAFTNARGGKSSNVEVQSQPGSDTAALTATNNEITNHLNAFSSAGFNNNWCETFRGLLTRKKKLVQSSTGGHWLNKAIYPMEFTLTIDGISGFTFGDVIDTNLLPAKYDNANMVFTVTKIDHKISNGVWETTLHTVSRIDAADTGKIYKKN